MSPLRLRLKPSLAVCALCAGLLLHIPRAAAADPLLMFLLGFAQNLITSSLQQRGPAGATPQPAPLPPAKLVTRADESDLRTLVDESFSYLSRAQRAELIRGLEEALAHPANAPYREAILTQFIGVAQQVRYTHNQLNRLTPEQKREVAARFAENYRRLSAGQQEQLAEQLRARALPVPADLADLMLAEMRPSN